MIGHLSDVQRDIETEAYSQSIYDEFIDDEEYYDDREV